MKAEINYEKREQLQQRIKQRLQEITEKDCIVAFSGGVDSALLLKMTCEAAEEKGTSELPECVFGNPENSRTIL